MRPGSSVVDYREAYPLYARYKATDREIAIALDVSKGSVFNWRKSHHLPCNGTRGKTYAGWHRKALMLRAEGRTGKEIAILLSKALQAVYKVLQRKRGIASVVCLGG